MRVKCSEFIKMLLTGVEGNEFIQIKLLLGLRVVSSWIPMNKYRGLGMLVHYGINTISTMIQKYL